jgi:type 2 lantibiotic biosynthesis protein LanM
LPDFTRSLSCLVEPKLDALAGRLESVPSLAASERSAIREGAADALYQLALRRASRVLILELNAARITGRLDASDSASRWDQFTGISSSRDWWESIAGHYPPLLPRLEAVLAARANAALLLARRLASDRGALAGWLSGGSGPRRAGADPGLLTSVRFGQGDSHRGGHTVAIMGFENGTLVYKPRSVAADSVLGAVLAEVISRVRPGVPADERIRVPGVLARDGYGWAEFVAHRYCVGAGELAAFYRGLGHWLGVMRLLGGTDMHAENVIACGPVPVVVDCETLFTPVPPERPSGLGAAADRARALVTATVLRTGMLPNRGMALAWRGVDFSAAGSLRGEQPVMDLPVIVDAGSDLARVETRPVPVEYGSSSPSPASALSDYWTNVIDGLVEATDAARSMDADGTLGPLLARFADCPVRVVPRATEVYEELARMLWHPVSLHDEAAAVDRAAGLLSAMARNVAGAPDDPAVIAAEIADLLAGDVPFFATTPRRGTLDGPGGTSWLPARDLVADALGRWRAADLRWDIGITRATLVSAYLNDGWLPPGRMNVDQPRDDGLDRRRRVIAARLISQLRDNALHGDDGTVAWIAPVLNPEGWQVRPLGPDAYGGLPGVAVVLAAYQREAAAGRADPVDGAAGLLESVLRTIRAAEDADSAARTKESRLRPPPCGAYLGLASALWAWLTLREWGAGGPDALDRACALGARLPAAADDRADVLTGLAGAIVPLLRLSAVTGDARWAGLAEATGEKLAAAAQIKDGAASWSSRLWPDGIGGFAHGSSGIGWALARLALAAGQPPAVGAIGLPDAAGVAGVARAAFAFEEGLWDGAAGGWRDLRYPGDEARPAAWCHGGVGIGLAAADLARRGWPDTGAVIGRAARLTDRLGFGWSHTLCHGDMGSWELMSAAIALGQAPAGMTQRKLDARVVTSLEDHGPVSGLARHVYSPGLMAGLGGVAYQLLRMHPGSGLPSILIMD